MRNAFIDELVTLARQNPKIILTNCLTIEV